MIAYDRYRAKLPLEIYREAQVLHAELMKKGKGDIKQQVAAKTGV